MKILKHSNKLLGWIILSIPVILYSQPALNQTFFTGYYGAGQIDSLYFNNAFVERTDTGLRFSEKIYSTYDFFGSQNSTYCDANGTPLLQWHGCALLDAKTFEPIANGDFSNGPGTHTPQGQYCDKITPGPGLQEVTREYAPNFPPFFLDRGDDRNILLVYFRVLRPPGIDSNYIYTSRIDLRADEGPKVIVKDSLLVDFPAMSGSISAVRHANGIDWYIVFAEYESQNWYSILFDHEGLHTPVVSKIEQWTPKKVEGLSKFTPDGTKYVLSAFNSGFIVMDFDRCTGKFRYLNQAKIPGTELGSFFRFIEISPNGRFLYINDLATIHQFDFDDPNFVQSRTVVAKIDTSLDTGVPFKGGITSPVLGYDNKIYYWTSNTIKFYNRIALPDKKGPDVGWKQFYNSTPIYIPWFLPSFIDYRMGPLDGSPCESSNNYSLIDDFISCYPNPAQDNISAAIDRKYDKASVVVYNFIGQIVHRSDVPNLRSGINISKWNSGPYIVHIDGKPAGRFVKI